MFNPMLAAINKRKSGGMTKMGDHQDMSHPSEHSEDADMDNTQKLHDFVSSLSEGDKSHLKTILDKSNNTAQEIAKGGPSTEEKAAVEKTMKTNNQRTQMAEDEEHEDASGPHIDSDEIGKSMLDSRFTSGNTPNVQPKSLGDRVKMDIYNKLKGKGKV